MLLVIDHLSKGPHNKCGYSTTGGADSSFMGAAAAITVYKLTWPSHVHRAAALCRTHWVHSDVHCAGRVQVDLRVFKDEALVLGLDGQVDGEDLLRNH
jgi:hypothetical protein